MLMAFAQVMAITSENLLNGICQIIYSLYWDKEITKNVCNNIMNLVKLAFTIHEKIYKSHKKQ